VPLRFFRRIRIAPGVSVNLSKSGPSVSVGPKGAKVTVGTKGVRKTVGLPGTGLYYTTTSPVAGNAAMPTPAPIVPIPAVRTRMRGFWARRSLGGKAVIVVIALAFIGALNPNRAEAPLPVGADTALTVATLRPSPVAPKAFVAAPAVEATPEPTPEPTAAPTPRPTPKPTPKSTQRATVKPTSRCHPSYQPCLPIVADLDCPDVRAMGKAPVRVIGPDSYRLDRDHDGIGCE
jgi:hypothetical protein